MQQTDFKFFRRLTALGVVTLLAFSLAPYIPFSIRLTDLPSHFVLQYAIAALASGFMALLLKMARVYLFLIAVIFALNMATLAPYIQREQAVMSADLKTFKILQVNTLYLNHNTKPLEDLIRTEDPDIITAVETNDAFAAMFKKLVDLYPHQDIHPREDARGLAVLSKFPLANVAVKVYGEPVTPAQTFTVNVHGQNIRFVSMHPYTPIRTLAKRDAHMFAIAKTYAAPQATPLIITGDFNATPWSPAMKKFMRQTGLLSARAGRGVLPTWPTFLPTTFLRIPIDHILVSEHLRVVSHTLGGNTGADHLPTLAVIGIHTP